MDMPGERFAWGDGDSQLSIGKEGFEPAGASWQEWFDRATHVDDDFLADRAQGVAEDRQPW